MPLIAATIQLGAYISIFKLIVFIVGFFAWLTIVIWINKDAKEVHTKVHDWTIAIFLAGAIGSLVWLFIPLFLIGLPIYVIAVGATTVTYIMHRNSIVDPYKKIFTTEHIKGLFVNEQKQIEKINKGLVFITANKNKVPPPEVKTPEFYGFKMAQEFFDEAIKRRASDIVMSPAGQQYQVSFIVDGVAEKQPTRAREDVEYFIRYLKHLADLDVEEKRKPQTGRFTTQKDGRPYEWEVTTAGTTAGEQVRLKQMSIYNIPTLAELGLMPEQLTQFQSIGEESKGIFIISGPRKSGVTSTLYALIRHHDPFLNNINILEKQPIGELPNVTQIVYSLSDTGTTSYAKRLQSILRTAPDIIGVEHCEEDKDIARLTCSAAKDKKMVYVTMEAASVIDAIGKWFTLVGDRDIAVNYLIGVCNQRLIRKLCDKCKEPYEPNKELLRKFNIPADKIKYFYRPGEVHVDRRGRPHPCEKCQGTGFFGREAIFECIFLNDETRKLLKQVKSKTDIANICRHARMLYLQEQAIRKVAAGITSINEVIRVLGPQETANKKKPETTA